MADPESVKIVKQGVTVWNQWRQKRSDIEPDLRDADLHNAQLSGINFDRTRLNGANLRNANLRSASLKAADLSQTDLRGARLQNAWLYRSLFRGTLLQQANFYHARLLETMFLTVDLREVLNLEQAFHLGPSTIGLDTIQQSRGNIPDTFLRGAGVPEQLVH